ncbi:hypothetical protein FPV67DRAFT_1676766 [Lyophyllum atratum]|nr:hypothetical protein FPV67DRAFT_1676766 [Lyophyllum atratum]
MASPPLSSIDTIQTFLKRIEQQERSETPYILHYDPEKQDLRPWLWPVKGDGQRIRPEDLDGHCETHDLRAPSCLCAILDRKPPTIYVEGIFHRQGDAYKVSCASNRCGYSIALGRFYTLPALPVKKYGLRRKDCPEDEENRVGKRVGSDFLPLRLRIPKNGQATTFGLLMQLDDATAPGLPGDIFANIFVQCIWCRWVTTSDAFHRHTCLVAPAPKKVLSDLALGGDTGAESDAEAEVS